jgi:peptidoglycan/LPS O-acetylase OafA/YrhL
MRSRSRFRCGWTERLTSARSPEAPGQPSPPTAPFTLGYRPPLDGLRGVSILAVMSYHIGLIRGGFLGVDIFFVLSGFLITTLLMDEWARTGRISLGQFYARRALRLLPALVALVIACDVAVMIIARLYWPEVFGPVVLGMVYASVAALLYMANWVVVSVQTLWILGHTWSLSIEEQFYLIWPLCLLALLRWVRRRGFILALLLLGISASLILKVALVRAQSSVLRIFFGLDTRFDELLIGCVVGVFASWGLLAGSRRSRGRLGAAAGAGAALLAFMLWRAVWRDQVMLGGGLTAAAAAAGVLIADIIARPSGWLASALGRQPLVGIGRISYGLYLWHFPIVYGCGALAVDGTPPDFPRASLAVGLTFLVAAASFRWIEQPMLKIKRRFTP